MPQKLEPQESFKHPRGTYKNVCYDSSKDIENETNGLKSRPRNI